MNEHEKKRDYNSMILNVEQGSLTLLVFSITGSMSRDPAGIYLLKVNNRNTRTRCDISSKLTIKIQEQHHWRRSGIFIVNFEHISDLVLVFLLLTLDIAKRLCQMMSLKEKEEISLATYGIRCKMSYALLRSSSLYIRGSRKMSSKYVQLNTVMFSAIDLAKNNKVKINIPLN